MDRSLAAIARDNDRINAITQLDADGAYARAATIDASSAELPLRGLTFVAKELIDVARLLTTGGSRLLDPKPADQDAAIVARLEEAGAVVVGKSNMHELAVGGARNPWFGQVVNPLSAAHGTGGTSSGSVAAVAAGFVDFALGTDSGGSNRSTAAATGLYGFKPTNGILSLAGVRPVAPTLDTVGVVAGDGAMLARVFGALVGRQPRGEITLEGRIIARPVGLHGPVDGTVADALDLAAEVIRSAGGQIVEIAFDKAATLREAGRDILRCEFLQLYGRDVAARPGHVGADVRAFMEVASGVSRSRYEDALAVAGEHRAQWHRQLQDVDAIMLPTAPGLAPRIEDEHTLVGDEWVPYGPAGADLRMWANTVGIPAVAVPVSHPGRLPASIQLASRPNSDSELLGLAAALGQAIERRAAGLR